MYSITQLKGKRTENDLWAVFIDIFSRDANFEFCSFLSIDTLKKTVKSLWNCHYIKWNKFVTLVIGVCFSINVSMILMCLGCWFKKRFICMFLAHLSRRLKCAVLIEICLFSVIVFLDVIIVISSSHHLLLQNH